MRMLYTMQMQADIGLKYSPLFGPTSGCVHTIEAEMTLQVHLRGVHLSEVLGWYCIYLMNEIVP